MQEEDYLKSVETSICETGRRLPGEDTPISGLSPEEVLVAHRLMNELRLQRGGSTGFRGYYELGQGANAYVVTLLCWLPLLSSVAENSGKSVVFVATTGETESGARLHLSSLRVLSNTPEVVIWGDLVGLRDYRPKIFDTLFIIGDLDYKPGFETPLMSSNRMVRQDAIVNCVNDLASDPSKHVVFFHREGWPSPFDLKRLSGDFGVKSTKKPGFWRALTSGY